MHSRFVQIFQYGICASPPVKICRVARSSTRTTTFEMSAPIPLRVLVVDDNERVRRVVCQLLRSESDMEVVAEAADGADAICKAKQHMPDIVLLDATMPDMNGLEAARVIQEEIPSIRIVMVSQHDSRGFQWAALAAGASAYVVKSDASRDLIPMLRKVHAGGADGVHLASFDHWSTKR